MGARVDKVDPKSGVVRGTLAADIASGSWNKVIGVGFNASGQVVVGAGQTGIKGVIIADRTCCKAGQRIDVFKIAEIILSAPDLLTAGTNYTVLTTTGVMGTTAADSTHIAVGYTVENDRLVLQGLG